MRLEKVSLGIIAVVVLIVLAVPFWRGLTLSQLRQSLPCREETIWDDSVSPSIPSPHPKTNAQLLKEHPNDFMLRLAMAQEQMYLKMISPSDRNKSQQGEQAARALLRDFPGQGAVYALVRGLPEYENVKIPPRMEGWSTIPEEAKKNWHDPGSPTKEQIGGCRHCIDLMDKAIAVDPGNGWFHYGKAIYLYSLHRDTEAQLEIHRTAIAPQFSDYSDLSSKAWDHLCDLRGGFDPVKREAKLGALPFPYYAEARETARITAHLAYAQIRRGNTSEGIRMIGDLTTSGYNMAQNAPTLIQALVARSIMAIGANALDPKLDPKINNWQDQQSARMAHNTQFLISHSYRHEADVLNKQWRQMEEIRNNVNEHADDFDDAAITLETLPVAFSTATGAIAIILVFCVIWSSTALLTTRGGCKSLWNKRACVTSVLLSSLIFAPAIVELMEQQNPYWSQTWAWSGIDLPEYHSLRPIFLLIPLGVIILTLAVGLVMMFRRSPAEGENRKMPVWSLLVAYLAGLGGLAYLAYGMDDFAESSRFFESLRAQAPMLMILCPIVLVILYGLLRAMQSRFGHVRRSAPLTFFATLRYGSALAVAIFAVVYLCLMPYVANLGIRADDYARNSYTTEAAIVQKAFK